MINHLNKIISKIKGEEFKLDSEIPPLYIFVFFVYKTLSLIYGILILRKLAIVFVHPSAVIRCASKIKFGKNFSIGRSCYIDALSKEGLVCGSNVSMGFHTHIDLTGSLKCLAKGIKIGNNVGLGSHGHYGSGIGGLEIGDDTIIGNYVSFHPENHNHADLDVPIRLQGVSGKGITVGKNCWVGAKVTFLDGSILGDGCIVAAGAVVRGIFPNNVVIGGVPAKIIKSR
ncbi:acyltransferase [Dyadobacter chenwenxiniae]|uniref:acyltransferase n=1 Tax=Dyadobacter chenwenxiniae TaxID=2906456 RepID=UPI0023DF267F|nr:acyltransferase [Dyadobacter chenwenxiniae]